MNKTDLSVKEEKIYCEGPCKREIKSDWDLWHHNGRRICSMCLNNATNGGKKMVENKTNEEKELGRIKKNETTDLVIKEVEFRGKIGIDIREYVDSETYQGPTKKGVRINKGDEFKAFQKIIGEIV